MMKDNREKVSKILIDFICLIFCIHFGVRGFIKVPKTGDLILNTFG